MPSPPDTPPAQRGATSRAAQFAPLSAEEQDRWSQFGNWDRAVPDAARPAGRGGAHRLLPDAHAVPARARAAGGPRARRRDRDRCSTPSSCRRSASAYGPDARFSTVDMHVQFLSAPDQRGRRRRGLDRRARPQRRVLRVRGRHADDRQAGRPQRADLQRQPRRRRDLGAFAQLSRLSDAPRLTTVGRRVMPPASRTLSESASKALLREFGVPIADEREVTDRCRGGGCRRGRARLPRRRQAVRRRDRAQDRARPRPAAARPTRAPVGRRGDGAARQGDAGRRRRVAARRADGGAATAS